MSVHRLTVEVEVCSLRLQGAQRWKGTGSKAAALLGIKDLFFWRLDGRQLSSKPTCKEPLQ